MPEQPSSQSEQQRQSQLPYDTQKKEYEAAAARFQEIVEQHGPQSSEAGAEAEELRARFEAYLATLV